MAVKRTKRTAKPRLSISSEGVIRATDELEVKEEPRRAPVSQVVEVVDEDTERAISEPLEEIKEEAKHIERNVDILEKTMIDDEYDKEKTEPEEEEAELEEVATEEGEESEKETLSEMFKKEQPVGLNEISIHKRGFPRTIIVWAIIVIVAAFLLGFGLLSMKGKKPAFPGVFSKPTPTVAPTSTPTPTPVPPDRTGLTVEVINGGGVAGAGSKMKALLEEKGYTVSKVGNAKEYTYDKTEIVVKASKSNYLTTLEGDLKDSYSMGSSSATLAEDASYDAQVIVGKE